MISAKVWAVYDGWLQMGGFYQVAELAQGGSVTNGASPSSFEFQT